MMTQSSPRAYVPRTVRRGVLNSFRAGFTLVELLVVIAIIGILVALLLPAIQAAREAARRAQCSNNIKNIALAVLNYESNNKVLPKGVTGPDGTWTPANVNVLGKTTGQPVGPNWVIQILSEMEEQALYDRFEKTTTAGKVVWTPINNPGANNVNVEARGTIIPSMLCPSDNNNQVKYEGHSATQHGANWARGNYAASAGRAFLHPLSMSGPSSKAWSGTAWSTGDNLFCLRGVIGPDAGVKLGQITDGTSKTIMLGELRAGPTDRDSRGVWALGLAGSSLLARYGSNADSNGPNACSYHSDDVFSDVCDTGGGGLGCAPATNSPGLTECMTCHFEGNAHQATARSRHPGGVHVAFADASVQFINDDVDTSGCYGACCSVWDWMIASADSGYGGGYNGQVRGNVCY